jgi:hypothetical protein
MGLPDAYNALQATKRALRTARRRPSTAAGYATSIAGARYIPLLPSNPSTIALDDCGRLGLHHVPFILPHVLLPTTVKSLTRRPSNNWEW